MPTVYAAARGFDTALPSFDQDVAIRTAGSDDRPLASHLDEFRAIRDRTADQRR